MNANRRFSSQARVVQGFFPSGQPRLPGGAVMQTKGVGQPQAAALPGSFTLPSSGGKALPTEVRQKMEAFFRTDFSDVRIHVGPHAQSIGALAFTAGSDIFFAPGQYMPDNVRGQQLLGHELTHVVQQRTGRVRNMTGHGLAVVYDQALEAEADRVGRQAALGGVAAMGSGAPPVLSPVAPQVMQTMVDITTLPTKSYSISYSNPNGVATKRPGFAGPVEIDTVVYDYRGSPNEYTLRVKGTVLPTTTKGRKQAPLPLSASTQMMTHSGADRGHLMALELGGPDVGANILAQWREWQQHGNWRKIERRILGLAKKWMKITEDSWGDNFASWNGRELIMTVEAVHERITHRCLVNPGSYCITLEFLDKNGQTKKVEVLAIDSEQDPDACDKRLAEIEELLP